MESHLCMIFSDFFTKCFDDSGIWFSFKYFVNQKLIYSPDLTHVRLSILPENIF